MVLLCLAGWQMPVLACNSQDDPSASRESATIGCTNDDMPQWEDLGMEDLLVVVSQPTVTAPTTMRLSNDHGSPLGRAAAASGHLLHRTSGRSVQPHRAQPGYIYRLLCLRL